MKITDKELKKEAKKTHDKILNDNKEWYNAFVAEKYGKNSKSIVARPKFKLKPKFIAIATSLSLAIALTITLLVIFLPNTSDTPTKSYFRENEDIKDVEFSTILYDMQKSTLEINTDYVIEQFLTYDKVSNDSLYYSIYFDDQDAFCAANIYIVCNKDYTFDFSSTALTQTSLVNGFEVKYFTSFELVDEGLYMEEGRAIISTGKEMIYVEYSGFSSDEEGIFLNWLNNTIKNK